MTCIQLQRNLDDYIDGAVHDTERRALDQHVEGCSECRQAVAAERRLRGLLRDYRDVNMPTPDAQFYDRSLVRAAQAGATRQRKHWVLTGFGGALAAGLVIWMIAGPLMSGLQTGNDVPAPTIHEVTMALETPSTINLVFSSDEPLTDATLTVNLPAGIELQGFAGQQEITWMTSLVSGKNVLPLKLVATMPFGGELYATLRHEDDDRIFRVKVEVI